jgi:hypothetical protein
MAAVSWLAEMYVVALVEPLNRMVEPETNPVPTTVTVKDALPVVIEVGEREETVGTGFGLATT